MGESERGQGLEFIRKSKLIKEIKKNQKMKTLEYDGS